MAEGGPTQKELEELRKNAIGYNKLINQLFGRTLNMTVSDVSGREQILILIPVSMPIRISNIEAI